MTASLAIEKQNMKPVKYLLLIFLYFIGCEYSTEPEPINNNPIAIKYSKSQEIKILTLWNDFLTEYTAVDKVNLFLCDSITSFVIRVEFIEGIKVISDSNININDNQVKMDIFNFFKHWEGLFGTSIDITQIDMHENWGYIFFNIWQKKFRNKNYHVANDPFLHFYFKDDGTLWKIESTLIPDIYIEEPSSVNTNKMMDNILGKTLIVNESTNYLVLFNFEYQYSITDGYWIYLEKEKNEYYLYLLKGIRARKEVWENHYAIYDIICHHYTNEVIYIKTYGID